GLLGPLDVLTPRFAAGRVDYGAVIPFKQAVLRRAWGNFQASAPSPPPPALEEDNAREAPWLDDYSPFLALQGYYEGRPWHEWHNALVLRKPAALKKAREQLADGIGRHRLGQFLFSRQWSALKQHAHDKKIRLIGDVPIFVSIDSSDVWANPDLFKLDEERKPTVVAGVPPDYFSATGQLWGNPHYDWEAMKKAGYAWWIARFRKTVEQADLVRRDHFRGFEAAWEIPAGNETAVQGEWVPGPGAGLLVALQDAFSGLPLIAEDLGVITPPVDAMRKSFHLPGMRI